MGLEHNSWYFMLISHYIGISQQLLIISGIHAHKELIKVIPGVCCITGSNPSWDCDPLSWTRSIHWLLFWDPFGLFLISDIHSRLAIEGASLLGHLDFHSGCKWNYVPRVTYWQQGPICRGLRKQTKWHSK